MRIFTLREVPEQAGVEGRGTRVYALYQHSLERDVAYVTVKGHGGPSAVVIEGHIWNYRTFRDALESFHRLDSIEMTDDVREQIKERP